MSITTTQEGSDDIFLFDFLFTYGSRLLLAKKQIIKQNCTDVSTALNGAQT